jgi:hypothetical protein
MHRLGPVDLKIYSLKKIHDCDATADKVLRLSQKNLLTSAKNYLCNFRQKLFL